MRTYAALAAASTWHLGVLDSAEYPHVLISYHYDTLSSASAADGTIKRNRKDRFVDGLNYVLPNLMLDSGAFSVSASGSANLIDLDSYIEWAKMHADRFPNVRVTNLDVIPKRDRGASRAPSESVVMEAVEQGAANAERIRNAGLRVIEVYHLFEPLDVWRGMLERRREGEVLGIGGLVIKTVDKSVRRAFGDAIFSVVRDMCGWDAVPPIHAFGAVSSDIAWRYPIASCDASSWVSPYRWGQRVGRGGKLTKLGRKASTISRDKEGEEGEGMRSHQLNRQEFSTNQAVKLLNEWKKRDDQVDEHWRRRGVTFLPEGEAYVSGRTDAA